MNQIILPSSFTQPQSAPTSLSQLQAASSSPDNFKMMFQSSTVALLLVSGAVASPIFGRETTATKTESASKASDTPTIYDWSDGWTKGYTIHQSCNSTLRHQLADGLDEAVQLAQHAKEHLLRFGSNSEFVTKYFGNGSTSGPIGWYDRIINADKTGVIFRCDDPDENCATQDGE